jgi:hypothetical protein
VQARDVLHGVAGLALDEEVGIVGGEPLEIAAA